MMPYLTIKSVVNQWYWSYEYPDFNNLNFNSYIDKDFDNVIIIFRLLDVDNRMVIPYNIPIRILTTSNNFIQSWTVSYCSEKIYSRYFIIVEEYRSCFNSGSIVFIACDCSTTIDAFRANNTCSREYFKDCHLVCSL